jgi:hypothetical protein
MPDLAAFAALAVELGAVPPVPPGAKRGGTPEHRQKPEEFCGFQAPVPPVPPVPPENDADLHEAVLRDAYEERAAILEFDAGLSRPEAERRARIEVYGTE